MKTVQKHRQTKNLLRNAQFSPHILSFQLYFSDILLVPFLKMSVLQFFFFGLLAQKGLSAAIPTTDVVVDYPCLHPNPDCLE